METNIVEISEPKFSKFLFADTRFSWFWLIIRVFVGWDWLSAGWGKFQNPVWVGSKAGVAVEGFLNAALQKTSGPHPDVSNWYAAFIETFALPNSHVISYVVTFGELAVGIGLILGIFTGIAAFFGSFMNLNFLFAGTVSANPFMLLLQLFLILGWRTAGWLGFDRYLLPKIGVPWKQVSTEESK